MAAKPSEEDKDKVPQHMVPTLRTFCLRTLQQKSRTIHEKLVLFEACNSEHGVDILGDDEDCRTFKNHLVADLRKSFPTILEMYKENLDLIEQILGAKLFEAFLNSTEEVRKAKKILNAYRSGSIKEREQDKLSEDELKLASRHNIYPYRVLQGGVKWPEGIEVTAREMYLSDAEFKEVMGMSKEAYQAMAKHKRDRLKKERNLF